MSYRPYGASPNVFQSVQQYQNQLQSAAAGNGLAAGALGGMTVAANTLGLGGGQLGGAIGILGSNTTTIGTSSGLTFGSTVTLGSPNVVIQTIPSIPWRGDQRTGVNVDKLKQLEAVEPRKLKDKIADSVAPIVGWRCWLVKNVDGELRLGSVGVGDLWYPKKAISAVCREVPGSRAKQGHKVPCKSCTCGFWAFKDKERLLEAVDCYSNLAVIGTVSLWGNVIETKNGFRAQYAYPAELWLLEDGYEELSLIYNVPIRAL